MACKYTYNGVEYSKEQLVSKLSNENSNFNTLYNNLVNEITNTETGRKVLDRIKRDYVNKTNSDIEIRYNTLTKKWHYKINKSGFIEQGKETFNSKEEAEIALFPKYTLEDQQEEAIVELMSLMVADKLNKITDKNLISLLKQLLKQINDFIKSLLNTKELNINDIEADNTKFLIENKLKELIKNGTIKKEC